MSGIGAAKYRIITNDLAPGLAYTPVGKTERVVISKDDFEEKVNDPKEYSELRKQGFHQNEIFDILTTLNPTKDRQVIEAKINGCEFSHKTTELNGLLKTLESDFESAVTEKRSSFINEELNPRAEATQKLAFTKTGITEAKNLIGVTKIDESGGNFVATTQTNDDVHTKQKDDPITSAYSFENHFSPDKWTIKYVANRFDDDQVKLKTLVKPQSKDVPSTTSVVTTQAGIIEGMTSESIYKPKSIVIDTVVNKDTINGMNDWYKAQNKSLPINKKPTTLESIDKLIPKSPDGKTLKGADGKPLKIPHKGLSEVENFLLNTPLGRMTKNLLKDINSKNEISSINISYKQPISKVQPANKYNTRNNFEILIKYKQDPVSVPVSK